MIGPYFGYIITHNAVPLLISVMVNEKKPYICIKWSLAPPFDFHTCVLDSLVEYCLWMTTFTVLGKIVMQA